LRDQHPIKWIVVEMGRYFNELSFVCGYCRGIRGVLNQLGEHRNRLQFESFHHRYPADDSCLVELLGPDEPPRPHGSQS
jgi:hypothetical protein